MPILTTLLIGSGLVSAAQWLLWDGREDDSTQPLPWTSLANLRRHVSHNHLRRAQEREQEVNDEADRLETMEPEVFPSYERIVRRSRSLHVLAEKKKQEHQSQQQPSPDPSSSSLRVREPGSPPNEFPRPRSLKPLSSTSKRPSVSSSSSTGRQPSLTLSTASSSSRTTTYPLTPEHSQATLPPLTTISPSASTAADGIRILPPQTHNDATDADVVETWLGAMELEDSPLTKGACGAKECEGRNRGRCACVEEGETQVRGRRMEYC